MGAHHELHATPASVHWGFFEAGLPPVLEIESGDRLTLHSVSGGPDVLPPSGFEILPEHEAIHREVARRMIPGHILTGPVAVKGARPGDVLEVRILDVRLRQDWGWNVIRPLVGALPEDFPETRLMHIPLDGRRMVAKLPTLSR